MELTSGNLYFNQNDPQHGSSKTSTNNLEWAGSAAAPQGSR
jgi:hypothetical protein